MIDAWRVQFSRMGTARELGLNSRTWNLGFVIQRVLWNDSRGAEYSCQSAKPFLIHIVHMLFACLYHQSHHCKSPSINRLFRKLAFSQGPPCALTRPVATSSRQPVVKSFQALEIPSSAFCDFPSIANWIGAIKLLRSLLSIVLITVLTLQTLMNNIHITNFELCHPCASILLAVILWLDFLIGNIAKLLMDWWMDVRKLIHFNLANLAIEAKLQ